MDIILNHKEDKAKNLGIANVETIVIKDNRLYFWAKGKECKCDSVSIEKAESIYIKENL